MATYTWRVTNGAFDVPSDWVNNTTGETPATTAPSAADTANLNSGGGTITGVGTVATLTFNGPAWTIAGQLNGASITITSPTAIASGGTLIVTGSVLTLTDSAAATATLTVDPGGSLLSSIAPQSARYVLDIDGSGTADLAHTLTVQGTGALLDLNGNAAAVGQTASGTLNVVAGAIARLGSPDPINGTASLSVGRAGQGVVNVSGAGSQLFLSGPMYAGRASGSSGVVNVADGASLVAAAVGASGASNFGGSGTLDGTLLFGGVGQLNVTGGGTASYAGGVGFGGSGSSGAGFVSGTGSTLAVGGVLRVGFGTQAPGGTGSLTINNGGVVQDTAAADPANAYLAVGDAVATTGAVTVDGTGSLLDMGQNSAGIGRAGAGSLDVSNGGTVLLRTTDSRVRAALGTGNAAGGSGTVSVVGTGSSVYVAGYAYFGRAGTGTLVVDRGGSFTGGSAATGDGTGANASFGVTIGDGTPNLDASGAPNSPLQFGGKGLAQVAGASLLYSLGNLRVGYRGTAGGLLVDGGSLAQGARETLIGSGTDRPGATGNVVVMGGSALLGGGEHLLATAGISLGSDAGTTGTVTVTGAGSLVNANGDRLTVGGAGTGTLTVAAGARALSGAGYADTEAALAVGAVAGAAGTVGVDGAGSQLFAAGMAVIGGTDTGAGVVAGGSGRLAATGGALLQTGAMQIFTGSAVGIDAASAANVNGDLTDAGTLSSNGRLTVSGALSGGGTVLLGGGLTEIGSLGGMTLNVSGAATTVRLHGLTGANVVSGLQVGNTIDLAGMTGLSLGADNTVTAPTGTLALGASPAGASYHLLGDANGGTDVVLTPSAPPANAIAITDVTNPAGTGVLTGDAYSGAVDYLQRQFIFAGTDSVAIRANVPNAFLASGSGDDALQAVAGNNVLNGGGGSSFLVGSPGADGGRDTFILDVRGGAPTWSTLVNFHSGDTAMLLGFHAGTSALAFTPSEGAAGYTGATIHAETAGAGTGIDASLTFAGIDLATAQRFAYSNTATGGVDTLVIHYG